MSTKKSDGDDAVAKVTERAYEIKQASIKDDFCNYSYEITLGIGEGDTCNVKGKGIVDRDLSEAMARLNVHLAFVDDAFKNAGIDVEDIDKMRGHDLALLYQVDGLKMKGDEKVVLVGSKYVSINGRIELASPIISYEAHGNYKWYNELKEAVEKTQEEVALYKEGKCTPPSDNEPEEDPAQLSLLVEVNLEDGKV